MISVKSMFYYHLTPYRA